MRARQCYSLNFLGKFQTGEFAAVCLAQGVFVDRSVFGLPRFRRNIERTFIGCHCGLVEFRIIQEFRAIEGIQFLENRTLVGASDFIYPARKLAVITGNNRRDFFRKFNACGPKLGAQVYQLFRKHRQKFIATGSKAFALVLAQPLVTLLQYAAVALEHRGICLRAVTKNFIEPTSAYFGRPAQKFNVRRLHHHSRNVSKERRRRLKTFTVFTHVCATAPHANGAFRLAARIIEYGTQNQFVAVPGNHFLQIARPKRKTLRKQMHRF